MINKINEFEIASQKKIDRFSYSIQSLYQNSKNIISSLLIAMVLVCILSMVASLKWHFLDKFVVGTSHNLLGFDFFPVPRAFCNLLNGANMFLSEISNYGPYGSWYLYHPFVAVAIGSWTSILPPWIAYASFVWLSLLLLWGGARILSSHFKDSVLRSLTYAALFCSLPTYLMLWNAQVHILTVFSISLLMAGLIGLDLAAEPAKRYLFFIQLGVLISLLSKPITILMLPVLFALRETRKGLLLTIIVYTLVSVAFLVTPQLNVGGYNGIHWTNLLTTASTPKPMYRLLYPYTLDLTMSPEIFSLPMFLYRVFGDQISLSISKLPLVFMGIISFFPFFLNRSSQRIRMAIVAVSLCVLSHYLSNYIVWEYHYATLTPLIPTLLFLWQSEKSSSFRWLLMTAFLALLLIFIPTPYFLTPGEENKFINFATLFRVVPVFVAFICLTFYGFLYFKNSKIKSPCFQNKFYKEAKKSIISLSILTLTIFLLFLSIYSTTPSRFFTPLSQWTYDDAKTHYTEMAKHPSVTKQTMTKLQPSFKN